eukprot:scaffold1850_cov194-Pinguiococcus_pyrenoidosus.AAC.24
MASRGYGQRLDASAWRFHPAGWGRRLQLRRGSGQGGDCGAATGAFVAFCNGNGSGWSIERRNLPLQQKSVMLATTLDGEEQLPRLYDAQRVTRHLQQVRQAGGSLAFHVDATRLGDHEAIRDLAPFDCVRWNFPHVPSKMNVKKNRELLTAFLKSCRSGRRSERQPRDVANAQRWVCFALICCRSVMRPEGAVEILLVAGQGGTGYEHEPGVGGADAESELAWTRSWQVSICGSDAGLVLRRVIPWDAETETLRRDAGYVPQGARGRGKAFHASSPRLHVFSLPGVDVTRYGNAPSRSLMHSYTQELQLLLNGSFHLGPGLEDHLLETIKACSIPGSPDTATRIGDALESFSLMEDEFVMPATLQKTRNYAVRFRSDHKVCLTRDLADSAFYAMGKAVESWARSYADKHGGAPPIQLRMSKEKAYRVSNPRPSWEADVEEAMSPR